MSKDYGHKVFGIHTEIDIADIQVSEETRRPIDVEHIKSLKLSIARNGLINPITVYSSTSQAPFILLAGAHRLVAVQELGLIKVPARIYDYELSTYELKAIEVFENLHRKDMSEVEKAQATGELHELMVHINGPRVGGTGHSLQDTAKMLGRSIGSVSQDIKLAKAVKELPELGLDKIDSKTTAMRLRARLQSAIANANVANSVRLSPDNVKKILLESYVVGDFFAADLPAATYGFIEVDPPYAINLHALRKADDKQSLHANYEEISVEEYPTFLQLLSNLCYAYASDESWLVLWHGQQWYHDCVLALEAAGWNVCPIPAIWKKGNSPGQSQSPQSRLGNSYEQFLYARKGSPKLRLMGRSNIFDYPIPHAAHRIHDTERPKELIADLLRTFAWPGMQVLVPFAGSGNSLIAAHEAGHKCRGFDLSEIYRNAFVARVTGEQ